MAGSSILVTGAAGFIGSHLVERLLARGDRVVGLDNFDPFYPRETKERNLSGPASQRDFQLIEGDLRDDEALEAALSGGVDSIVHLAARAGVRPSIKDPAGYSDVNVRGTALLLQAAERAGVKRVIYASSSSVYGGNVKVPFSEDDPVDSPVSPYAATKKATELLASTFHHLYSMDTIGLRFFTVYGPRQRPEMAIHSFTRAIDAEEPVNMYGDGSSRRDYTYVDDCIDGVVSAIDNASGSRIFNLGVSDTTRLDELVSMIGRELGKEPRVRRLPTQPGDVPVTYADISRAKRELGYDPQTRVAAGIARFVRWYTEQRAQQDERGS